MISAGSLTVRATLTDGRLGNLDVDLRRPAVTQIFHGLAPEAVVKTVPCLYTICAHAQKAAAQAALAVAADDERPAADDAGLWVELLHENLWRLLLDWPPALGLPPEKEAFIAWRATRFGGNCADETKGLLANAFSGLAEKCLAKLVDRAAERSAPRGATGRPSCNRRPAAADPGGMARRLAGGRRAACADCAVIDPGGLSGAGCRSGARCCGAGGRRALPDRRCRRQRMGRGADCPRRVAC